MTPEFLEPLQLVRLRLPSRPILPPLLGLLATLLSEIVAPAHCEHDSEISCEEGCNLASGKCHPLQYVVTILPVSLSIMLSLRVDLDYERTAKVLLTRVSSTSPSGATGST